MPLHKVEQLQPKRSEFTTRVRDVQGAKSRKTKQSAERTERERSPEQPGPKGRRPEGNVQRFSVSEV